MSKEKNRILIYAEDPGTLKSLNYIINLNPDYKTICSQNWHHCLKKADYSIQVIVVQLNEKHLDLKKLKQLSSLHPVTPIVIVSMVNNAQQVSKAFRNGARDYVLADQQLKQNLLNALNHLIRDSEKSESINFCQETNANFSHSIIGESQPIKKVISTLKKAVKTNITVSIFGETGTGKEITAKTIHDNSKMCHGPFVAVNITAIPPELIESELFGHEQGAFSGAIKRRIGKFELANKGTILLDEIGEMSLNLQSKLLRVLQEKELVRIGGNEVIKLDVRVITATNRNLSEEVRQGNFRKDLYYRLLGIPVYLPPLRERGRDILQIARQLLEGFCKENHLTSYKFSEKAEKKLLTYSYPGNIRELKSIIELAAVMANNNEIKEKDLIFEDSHEKPFSTDQELTLKEYNLKIIHHFLQKYDHNVMKVAQKLQVGKSTIYRHLKNLEEKEYSF
ncbi:sigma-54 dependent transcriptional regulator [Xanthovirga aplysinae]|uniref:sigma-54 dependent transcriptional regulator n=1 Tax=Xanthovirga aplysinae TaxID=2529853 RepID=UPI0012BCC443|nr:sigma-54 dependent transcriptional regulator [Xanthovirga aplysinae]MTI31913.1 sigma-54-dependent Fis family transcriptional regulator [Xanthovirga aplysinae]